MNCSENHRPSAMENYPKCRKKGQIFVVIFQTVRYNI